MRAITYDRVSADRKQGRSVAEQHADNLAECERRGWTLVARYTDNARGASRHSRKARPGWEQVKTAITNRDGDVLVTWEASRAQRDMAVYLELRDLCRTHGVQWCYNGRLYDLNRTDDAFSTGLDALLAEREADLTRDRVLRAVRANAASGRPHGKLLYGYRREYDPDTGALLAQVERADQAAIVREIHDRVASGEPIRRIALDLEKRHIPAPRGTRWFPQTINHIATNPAYIGLRVHLDQVVGPAAWPALVDELVHYACVRRVTAPDRPVIDWTAKHLLSGIARCGAVIDGQECGRGLSVQQNRNHLAYLCRKGFHVSRHQDKLDQYVVDVVLTRLAQPDFAKAMAAAVPPDTAGALTSLQTLRKRLDDFRDAAADGQISPAALARIEAKLLPQIEEAEQAAGARPSPLPDLDPVTMRQQWTELPLADRRAVISSLLTPVVLPVGRGKRTFDPDGIEIRWH